MTATLTRPTILRPTGDPTPVEKAVVEDMTDLHEPETLLVVDFRLPSGGARVWHAWTTGGQPLGDQIDALAHAAGLDGADWITIADRNVQSSQRGRVSVQAYPLRAVLGDLQTGVRAPQDMRDRFRHAIVVDLGRPHFAHLPWLGFGPQVVNAR